MISEYKYVNGKVVAINDLKELKEYDYQDNIDKLLKQENVVEEINNIISELYNEKGFIEKYKKDYSFMLFNEEYGEKSFIIFMSGVLLSIIIMGLDVNNLFLRMSSMSLCLGSVPMTIYQARKFKKDNELKLFNLNEQIKEFENILVSEKEKLNELENDKSITNVDKYMANSTDNSKIGTLVDVENRKHLYDFYRSNCDKINKLSKKGKLKDEFSNLFSEDSIKSIDEMTKGRTRVLVKKR